MSLAQKTADITSRLIDLEIAYSTGKLEGVSEILKELGGAEYANAFAVSPELRAWLERIVREIAARQTQRT